MGNGRNRIIGEIDMLNTEVGFEISDTIRFLTKS